MISVDIKELSNDLQNVLDGLKINDGCVITEGQKPRALLIEIPEGHLEDLLQAIRQVKAVVAFNKLHDQARKKGFFSDEEIATEIQAARSHGKKA